MTYPSSRSLANACLHGSAKAAIEYCEHEGGHRMAPEPHVEVCLYCGFSKEEIREAHTPFYSTWSNTRPQRLLAWALRYSPSVSMMMGRPPTFAEAWTGRLYS